MTYVDEMTDDAKAGRVSRSRDAISGKSEAQLERFSRKPHHKHSELSTLLKKWHQDASDEQ